MDLYFNYYYQRKASAIWIVAVEANFFFYFPAGENSEPEIQNSGHCLDVKGLGGLSAVKKAGPIWRANKKGAPETGLAIRMVQKNELFNNR